MTGPLEGEAAGLRSGLLSEDCVVATPEMCPKSAPKKLEVCLMVLVRGARECVFEWLWEVLAGVAELFC